MVDNPVGASIVGNAGILVVAQIVTKVLGAIFAIIAARELGVEEYGLYTFAVTFGSFFGLLAAFGLSQPITREVARQTDETGAIWGQVLVIESVLTTMALGIMTVVLAVLDRPSQRVLIVMVIGATMLLVAALNVVAAFFRAHQRMELEALTRITASCLNLGLGLPILFAGLGVLYLAVAQLLVYGIALGLGAFLVTSRLARPVLSWQWMKYKHLLTLALPFALSSVLIMIYDGTAVVILSMQQGDRVVGLYSGALNFVRIFALLAGSIVAAMLPVMSRLWHTNGNAWRVIYQRALKYLLILALPLSVGLAVLSPTVVDLVLGEAYSGSSSILRLVAWVLILEFLNHGLSTALISCDQEKVYMYIVGIVMLLNVILNLLLIPRYGAEGAVVATLLTEGGVLLFQVIILSRTGIETPLIYLGIKPVLAVTAMGASISLLPTLSLLGAVLIGAVIYLVSLVVLGTFEPDEIGMAHLWWQAGWSRVSQWLG